MAGEHEEARLAREATRATMEAARKAAADEAARAQDNARKNRMPSEIAADEAAANARPKMPSAREILLGRKKK